MSLILAMLLGLAALLLPLYLIKRYGPAIWPLHVLAVAAAMVVGLAPATALLRSAAGSHIYGFTFVFLMTWGLGGLILYRRRGLKRA
ncbi:MAG: hypothetical protein ABSF25_17280 [Bryobacteraceae bacterium]|jgi:hypothetical protein